MTSIMPTVMPSPAPTAAPTDADNNNRSWETASYICFGLAFFLPFFITFIGCRYHGRMRGSDRPNYGAVFKCFWNIGDFYSDLIFTMLLLVNDNDLFYWCLFFTVVPHLISNIISLYCMKRWRESNVYVTKYIDHYDWFIIIVSVFAGFYSAIEVARSRLFYFKVFSLQIKKEDYFRIKHYRFFNNVLCENMPQLIIQLVYGVLSDKGDNMDFVVFSAMVFSALSLMIGLFQQISRWTKHDAEQNKKYIFRKKMEYKCEIECRALKSSHKYTHFLVGYSIAQVLGIDTDSIEVYYMFPIRNGLVCFIEVSSFGVNDRLKMSFGRVPTATSLQGLPSQASIEAAAAIAGAGAAAGAGDGQNSLGVPGGARSGMGSVGAPGDGPSNSGTNGTGGTGGTAEPNVFDELSFFDEILLLGQEGHPLNTGLRNELAKNLRLDSAEEITVKMEYNEQAMESTSSKYNNNKSNQSEMTSDDTLNNAYGALAGSSPQASANVNGPQSAQQRRFSQLIKNYSPATQKQFQKQLELQQQQGIDLDRMPPELLQIYLDMQDQAQAIAQASASAQMIGGVAPGVGAGAGGPGLNQSSVNGMNGMNAIPQMQNMTRVQTSTNTLNPMGQNPRPPGPTQLQSYNTMPNLLQNNGRGIAASTQIISNSASMYNNGGMDGINEPALPGAPSSQSRQQSANDGGYMISPMQYPNNNPGFMGSPISTMSVNVPSSPDTMKQAKSQPMPLNSNLINGKIPQSQILAPANGMKAARSVDVIEKQISEMEWDSSDESDVDSRPRGTSSNTIVIDGKKRLSSKHKRKRGSSKKHSLRKKQNNINNNNNNIKNGKGIKVNNSSSDAHNVVVHNNGAIENQRRNSHSRQSSSDSGIAAAIVMQRAQVDWDWGKKGKGQDEQGNLEDK